MKIAINGTIIDSKHIYKITPLEIEDYAHYDYYISIYFHIESFNSNILTINKCLNIRYFNGYERKLGYYDELITDVINKGPYQNYQDCPTFKEVIKDITRFRQKIVDIWTNNISDIPQFNFD